jgi:hypothetical protein
MQRQYLRWMSKVENSVIAVSGSVAKGRFQALLDAAAFEAAAAATTNAAIDQG